MPRNFESILDRHLNALISGAQPRVTEYAPDSAEGLDLASLLDVAQRVHAVPLPAPSAQAVAAGRMRLLQAVHARADARAARQARRERWMAWLRPALNGSVAAAMAVVAVVSVYAISTTSLPGSPLYTVKQASEQVRLALAASPVQRARVHLTLAERRLDEVQRMAQASDQSTASTLAAMSKETEAALGALREVPGIQAVPLYGDLASLARRQEAALLWMQTHSTTDEQPLVAQAVVDAHDNRQTALAASIDPQTAVAQMATSSSVVAVVDFRGPVVASSPDALSVGSRNVALAATTLVDGNTTTGSTVDVRAAETSDGQLLALSVRETLPADATIRIEGRVTGAYDSTWLINGNQVVFDANTSIVGWIAPGVDVQIEAVNRSDGKLLARTAQRWARATDPELSIEGPLVSHSGQSWVVGGCAVTVDSRTYIDESQALVASAAGAHIKASRAADGTLVAQSAVLLQARPAASITIKGSLTGRDGNQWRIGDLVIDASAATIVSGELAASKAPKAEILATLTADGRLVATRVVLLATETATGRVAVEFDGRLEWGENGPIVAGRSIRLGDASVVRSGARTVQLGQISSGRPVLVRGQLLTDGTVLVSEISIRRQGASTEISGTIEHSEDGLLVINGRNIVIDSAVQVLGPDGVASTDELTVGTSVTVVGQPASDGSLLAWEVSLPGASADPAQPVTALPTTAPSASPTDVGSGNGKPKNGPLPTGTLQTLPLDPTPTLTLTATATAPGSPTPAEVTATVTATLPAGTLAPSPTATPTPGDDPDEPTWTPTATTPTTTPATDDSATPAPSATPTAESDPGASQPTATPTATDVPATIVPPSTTPTPQDAPGCAVPPCVTPTSGDAPGIEPPPTAPPVAGDAEGGAAPPAALPATEPSLTQPTKSACPGQPGPIQSIRLVDE